MAEAKQHADQRFARMDANQDGVLNREDRGARQANRFAETDADGNGEVTLSEIDAAREARRAERAEMRTEWFAQADSDGSGGLSQEEMMAARQALGERRGGRGMRGRRGGGAMAMLRRADTNGDQAVSRSEFDAAVEARFARMDKDGSGTISAEEREAAKQARRAARDERRGERRQRRGY